ncbi:MAG TPA: CBS domain-containing protein [Stellaceae bacterium]|nr:CBS domain-containing protein [Stellaceae bacterium]
MQARDFMSTDPVTVSPDTATPEIARLLLEHAISAAPVVDADGALIGMVSEGDLLGRSEADREARRDWWLTLLAEGETLAPDFLATLRHPRRTARDVMSAPVVSIGETDEASAIAHLLREYRIKRVPVVREGRVVGIVSRADLIRVLAEEQETPQGAGHERRRSGPIGDIISSIDAHFGHRGTAPAAPRSSAVADAGLSSTDFRALAADFQHHNLEHQEEARRAAAEGRRQRVKDMIDHHIGDEGWRSLLHHAREAAARGAGELMLLQFPADLCTDRGRAINAPLPDWPKTLRGEAAEIYLRWERDLKPGGFHLTARVLNFPGGFPGDVGLFLTWD